MNKIASIACCLVEFASTMYFIVCLGAAHEGTLTKEFVTPMLVSGALALLLAVPSIKCADWLDKQ
ncbi:MAG: hypothetical protein II063_10430 [Prevotella sp.]|nr:hypothetical protein [Prevotella sp.]